ncbi:MAG: DUF1559 domain-containing protein [Planctomycetia bacterium]|nr:DUF1559 domain-containing protein [Planctomycetia bacterium]
MNSLSKGKLRRRALTLAFTLVELLVVIAIIGILIALLLPAVQAAREAARRMQCTNNLKQLAIAIHNYHDVNNCIPPGALYEGGAIWGTLDKRTNWHVSILPYMEQTSLASLYDMKGDILETAPDEFFAARISALECPSSPIAGELVTADELNTEVTGTFSSSLRMRETTQFRRISYRGISGRFTGLGHWQFPTAVDSQVEFCRGFLLGLGTIGTTTSNRWQTFAAVTDGLSNCIGIGETTSKSGKIRQPMFGFTGLHWPLAALDSDAWTYVPDFDACHANAANDGGWGYCEFNTTSLHPGIINYANCDGSVSAKSMNIDIEILRETASIGDGVVHSF